MPLNTPPSGIGSNVNEKPLVKQQELRATHSQHVNLTQNVIPQLMTNAYPAVKCGSAGAELPLAFNGTMNNNMKLGADCTNQSAFAEKQMTIDNANQTTGSISSAETSKRVESNSGLHARLMAMGIHVADEDKLDRIQNIVENAISHQARQQILQILEKISALKPLEKLLLYLRLPGETPDIDPLKQQQNPLGTRSEINHTINWVRTHLEQDPKVSIPKQDVYNDYLLYCERLDIKPLSTADFGKVMKQVFPGIRPRRLGTRGHSRYCYAAMRKASQLPPPHLPNLTHLPTGNESKTVFTPDATDTQVDSWNTVKEWTERVLHIKVDTLHELAQHIKNNANDFEMLMTASCTSPARKAIGNKKYSQREPKEKRLLADMGPLKKRRKKKRKESSSSESSSSQTIDNKINHVTHLKQTPNVTSVIPSDACKTRDINKTSENGNKFKIKNESEKFECQHEIKQEIIEACGPDDKTTSLDTFLTDDYGKQQVLPMNLAFATKGQANGRPNDLAIKSQAAILSFPSAAIDSIQSIRVPVTAESNQECAPPAHITIKEEVPPDNYDTSNVFCKKVLKAQQTKGYLLNAPKTSTASTSISIITTSVATSRSQHIDNAAAAVNFTMGPPTQNVTTFSPSQQTHHEDHIHSTQAKVLSRNLQQIRAKKLLLTASVTSTTNDHSDLNVVKDNDLPENLGLPRERVISICNMDKHELDDYFLPVEEDNSEDQETELLQYFQVGDVEKKNANNLLSDAATPNTNLAVTISTSKPAPVAVVTFSASSANTNAVSKATPTQDAAKRSMAACDVESKCRNISVTNDKLCDLPIVTIRSASASLTHLSQRHQQQAGLWDHLREPYDDKLAVKRKLNINTSNAQDIAAHRNYSFLPISPNINNTEALNRNPNNSQLFVSPNQSRLLNKQQSLDCDSSDPMIGSARRKRSYFSLFSISAPPSPSILKQHQEQQPFTSKPSLTTNDWSIASGCSSNAMRMCNNNPKVTRVHNSLDIEHFGVDSATSFPTYAVCRQDANLSSALNTNSSSSMTNNMIQNINDLTQRSQSVPLSQLQRRQSPLYNQTFHLASGQESSVYSACTSLTETPVPVDFSDSAIMLSENSCSQQSTSMQLEEVGGVVASDSTAILDDVDINDVLSSPDFITKFSSITESSTINTICPSAGSSSGYGSANNFPIASNNFAGSNSLSVALSRSVPSTPLPLQNSSDASRFGGNFCRRRFLNSHSLNGVADDLSAFNAYGSSSSAVTAPATYLTRSASDISKSMPCTPITTVPSSFRYSPSEMTTNFLTNASTIDDNISAPFGVIADSLLTADDDLINDCNSKLPDNLPSQITNENLNQSILGESSIVIATDLLDNL